MRRTDRSKSIAAIHLLESRRLFNAGDLDTTFGTNGGTTNAFGASDVTFYDSALQQDGKIVAVGATDASEGISSGSQVVVARFKTDGTLDTSFSSDGFELTNFNGDCEGALSVAIQSDGKILVSGSGQGAVAGLPENFGFIARLKTNGSLDSSFGTAGVSETETDGFETVAINSSGKIYALEQISATIFRFTSSGALDSSFGSGGSASFSLPDNDVQLTDMALQSDGKPVVTGGSTPEIIGSAQPSKVFVGRLTTGGTPDSSFATNGAITFAPVSSGELDSFALAVLSTGKIVVESRTNDLNWLTRFNTDGSADTTFGTGGTAELQPFTSDGADGEMSAIAVQSDGKIVIGGTVEAKIGLERVNTDGSIDYTFSVDGRTTNAAALEARTILINSANQIIVTGDALATGDTGVQTAIAAFNETGGENLAVVRSDQGELGITGTSGADTLNVDLGQKSLSVAVNGVATSFNPTHIKAVFIHAGDGNDTIHCLDDDGFFKSATTILGEAGNDSITTQFPSTVDGGAGDDHINSQDGGSLAGGDGNDHLFAGDFSAILDGGAGNDIEYGGIANDTISGDAGRDHLYGLGGADKIYGGVGNDYVDGGSGNDRLTGGGGTDSMYGQGGKDTFIARDSSADLIFGGSGADAAQIDSLDQTSSIGQILA